MGCLYVHRALVSVEEGEEEVCEFEEVFRFSPELIMGYGDEGSEMVRKGEKNRIWHWVAGGGGGGRGGVCVMRDVIFFYLLPPGVCLRSGG